MPNFNFEDNRFLDVVNENDEVIDSKSRADIHRFGLLHREIHVWMFDEDNNIFFQKRGLHRPSAGLLDATIGGHVNGGEDYIDAAVRETMEETSISISPTELILIKKITKNSPSHAPDSLSPANNFIRNIYVYKNPIKERQLQKEKGLLGAGFQKLSADLLLHANKEDAKMFDKFILSEEIPLILKYMNK
jgi:isopentenyldiphosphate isomerase